MEKERASLPETGIPDFGVIIFTGAPAANKHILPIADHAFRAWGGPENVICLPSITTPSSVNKDTGNITDHYKNLAEQTLKMLGSRNKLVITSNSLGGSESFIFLRAVAENAGFKGKSIEFVMTSPINMGNEGWQAIGELLAGLKKLQTRPEIHEAHYIYPLPREAIKNTTNGRRPELYGKIQYPDNKDILDRKLIFIKVANQALGPEVTQEILDKIAIIDREIVVRSADNLPIEDLLKKRALVISPFFKALSNGDFASTSVREALAEQINLQEKNKYLNFVHSILYFGGIIVSDMFKGHARVLRGLTDVLAQKGITLNTHLVFFDKDPFSPEEQVKRAIDQVQGYASTLLVMESGHFTMSYAFKAWEKVIKNATSLRVSRQNTED